MARKIRVSKKDIIQAGFDIAMKEGFADVTVRNVAKKANCSIATIYFNFCDIEGLKEHILLKALLKFEQILCEQNTESFALDFEIASVIYARDYSVFYDEIIIKKHSLFKSIDRIKDAALASMKYEKLFEAISTTDLLQLQLKRHIFQEGLALSAREEKYNSVFTKEYIENLLRESIADFIATIGVIHEN